MKILVAGASGFLGTHLSRRLLAHGHQVTPVPGRTVLWSEALAVELDLVIWAAGPARGIEHLTGVEVGGAITAFGALCDAAVLGCTPVLLLSSSAVYGPQDRQSVTEAAPLHPTTPYTAIQVGREALAAAFWHSHGLPTTVLRLGTVYGSGMHKDALVQTFLDAVVHGGLLRIRDDRHRIRPFVHVEDFLDFVELTLARLVEVAGRTFNVASDHTSAKGLAHQILAQAGAHPDARVVFEPNPPWAGTDGVLDCTAARALGWAPRFDLYCGLGQLLQAMRA